MTHTINEDCDHDHGPNLFRKCEHSRNTKLVHFFYTEYVLYIVPILETAIIVAVLNESNFYMLYVYCDLCHTSDKHCE